MNSLCRGVNSITLLDTFSKPEARTSLSGATPLRREGSPAAVANAVMFLACDKGSFVTGINMDVNGGLAFS